MVHRIEPSDKVGGIWWVYGNPGSGKTRVATNLKFPDAVVLDADDCRKLWPELGFTKADRWKNNLNLAELAMMIWHQGFNVVVASVCPYEELRKEIKDMIPWVVWVNVDGPHSKEINEDYESMDNRQRKISA
jgi:adenylylsulfate kinase